MQNRRYNCSEQANAFLLENLPVREAPPPTPDNIQQMRDETRQMYGDNIDYAMDNFVGRLEEVELNGVDCLVIHPGQPNPKWRDHRVLYFYGGGYIQGSPEEDLPVSAFISRHLGIEVVSPRYRLAPEHPYPAAHEDGLATYRAMLDVVSPDNLAVMGESAGGNLTLSTLLNARAESLPMPGACVMLSPWIDLTSSGDSLTANDGRDPTLTKDYVDQATHLYAGNTPFDDPAISPLFAEFPENFPRTLVTSGTRDLLLSQAVDIVNRLRARRCHVELRVFEHMWHVFEFYPRIPEASVSLNGVCGFLETALSPVRDNPENP